MMAHPGRGDPYRKALRGEPIKWQAQTYNALLDAARAMMDKPTGVFEPLLYSPLSTVVSVRNQSSNDVERFGILSATLPTILTQSEWVQYPVLFGQEPRKDRQIAIALEPIKAGSIGLAVVAGLAIVRLRPSPLNTSLMRVAAEVIRGDQSRLQASMGGQVDIIATYDDAVNEVLALVRIRSLRPVFRLLIISPAPPNYPHPNCYLARLNYLTTALASNLVAINDAIGSPDVIAHDVSGTRADAIINADSQFFIGHYIGYDDDNDYEVYAFEGSDRRALIQRLCVVRNALGYVVDVRDRDIGPLVDCPPAGSYGYGSGQSGSGPASAPPSSGPPSNDPPSSAPPSSAPPSSAPPSSGPPSNDPPNDNDSNNPGHQGNDPGQNNEPPSSGPLQPPAGFQVATDACNFARRLLLNWQTWNNTNTAFAPSSTILVGVFNPATDVVTYTGDFLCGTTTYTLTVDINTINLAMIVSLANPANFTFPIFHNTACNLWFNATTNPSLTYTRSVYITSPPECFTGWLRLRLLPLQ